VQQDPRRLFFGAVQAHQSGNLGEAEKLYRRVLKLVPDQPETLNALAHLERQRGRLKEAYELFSRALRANARSGELLTSRGNVALELGRPEVAVQDYDKALAIDGSSVTAWMNRGSALAKLGRSDEALASYDRAIALKPSFAPALYNRGNLLLDQQRFEEAELSYRRAIAAKPDYAEAFNNLGECLSMRNRLEEALQAWDTALIIRPDYPDTLSNRATALRTLGRHEEAVAALRRALQLDPGHPYTLGNLVYSELQICDWTRHAAQVDALRTGVRGSRRVAPPFAFAAVSESPEEQCRCAEIWIADRSPRAQASLWRGERYAHSEIRVAYVSSDFREHPVGYAIVDLLERHDRSRFRILGVNLANAAESPIRARLRGAVDSFIDVSGKSPAEAAAMLRQEEVDIVVDLNGHTEGARPGILALRPAPLQVNYLGYPGTMGAQYVDYILADAMVIPSQHEPHYSEKVVRLPGCYLPLDSTRSLPDRLPERATSGLPDGAFVFCSFTSSYKIRPEVFDVWMRLLAGIEDSVLWLSHASAAAAANLRTQAQQRGIAPERIVFAPRVSMEEHLSRHRLADLFLDTAPYNAHSTASDALWAGLPVLTCVGGAFAGRVGASLLHAAGLSELIVDSLAEYELRAVELATTPVRLGALRAQLARNRATHPLFDTDRLRRHVECAYATMWDRQRRGEAPAGFAVDALSS
jgi:predicted O-linked N-acetylglucosamine transferase (SPINDLY family)